MLRPVQKTTELAAQLILEFRECSSPGLIQAYEKQSRIGQFVRDAKQLLGLGQDQNRPYRAAVIHLYLVCFTYALLSYPRIEQLLTRPLNFKS